MNPSPRPTVAHLEYLCSGYFHQDWDLDGDGAQAVLDFFARSEQVATVIEARDAAAGLLAERLTDQELAEALDSAGLEYAPDYEGMTHREWLELVVDQLTRHLDGEEGTSGASETGAAG